MAVTHREKIFISVAAAALVLVLGVSFVIWPAIEDISTLQRVLPEKREDLLELRQIAEQMADLESAIEEMGSEVPEPEAGFSPLAFLEKTLGDSGIRSWSFSSPREIREDRIIQVAIDVRIEETGWEELIGFFSRVDTAAPSLQLSSFDIRRQVARRGAAQDMLRADITVTGLRRPD